MKRSKVEITVDATGRGSVVVDGKDMSRTVRAVRLEAGVGGLTVVHLALLAAAVTVTAEALVSGEVKEDAARQERARQRMVELRAAASAALAERTSRRVSQ